MEWYIGVIMILSAFTVGALVLIVNMIDVIDGLRTENAEQARTLARCFNAKH